MSSQNFYQCEISQGSLNMAQTPFAVLIRPSLPPFPSASRDYGNQWLRSSTSDSATVQGHKTGITAIMAIQSTYLTSKNQPR